MRSSVCKIATTILAKEARITISLSLLNSVKKTTMRAPDFALFCHKNRD
jgi:hypothetical protein